MPRESGVTRADGSVVLDDSELAVPHFSPVCTYCKWWKAGDGHHCYAYPKGGKKLIPNKIWIGTNMHITPYGGEAKDNAGNPYLFVPDSDVKRTKENAKLLDAYAKAHGESRS